MDKKEAIEFLNKELQKVPNLAKLNYRRNDDYVTWRNKIEGVLEAVYRQDSWEYKKFARDYHKLKSSATPRTRQNYYLAVLKDRVQNIYAIINKHELTSDEQNETAKANIKQRKEEANRVFDTMQFHPSIVAVSKSLFETGHYPQAIFEAYKAVNNLVKDKSGLSPKELRGLKEQTLMSKVFDESKPLIKLNELISDTDISEQCGFKFLFMGATVGIRNPKAHESIEMKDPYTTLEYLAFASLLVKKIDFWEAKI